MSNGPLLGDASAQEIQLELIRRRRFNEFDGQLIAESMQKHRDLWTSAFMTMSPNGPGDDPIPFLFLIPLRELPSNRWQVDTLFILCQNFSVAERLRQAARDDNWQFDADEIYVGPVVERALGQGSHDGAILELWWD